MTPFGRGKGTCFGCGKKLGRGDSWCHSAGSAGCRPSDWDGRELHLLVNGYLKNQRRAPADDPEAVWAAVMDLQALAIEQTSSQYCKLKWRIRAILRGNELTLFMDCMGHGNQERVAWGTAVRWEPLVAVPEPKRRGPPPVPMADDAAGHYNYAPSYSDRLAVGFAMLEGYEDQHRMRESRR